MERETDKIAKFLEVTPLLNNHKCPINALPMKELFFTLVESYTNHSTLSNTFLSDTDVRISLMPSLGMIIRNKE